MLSFFKSKPEVTEPESPTETLEAAIAEVHAAQDELREAGRAVQDYQLRHADLKVFFVADLTVRMNQFRDHPELVLLEAARSRALERFHKALQRHGSLKKPA